MRGDFVVSGLKCLHGLSERIYSAFVWCGVDICVAGLPDSSTGTDICACMHFVAPGLCIYLNEYLRLLCGVGPIYALWNCLIYARGLFLSLHDDFPLCVNERVYTPFFLVWGRYMRCMLAKYPDTCACVCAVV